MSRRCSALLLALLLACLGGCASLLGERDPPRVSVDQLRLLPAQGSGPRFAITLRIANPNRQALSIAGISYSLALLEKEVISGVTAQVPRIGPYQEETVTLEAGLDLLQVLRLLAELGRPRDAPLDYRFAAKIDFHGLVPTRRVEERGSITLQ